MSACIGASAAGARAYTATSSQGLLFMAEALPNASGLGLPIVMTVANRALGAPINIWNDHSDAMSQRDAGWVQLFAASNQEAVDLHVQAFALAERLSVPVMVCMDGFVLTHAMEEIDVPEQDAVDAFLPPFGPRQWLDPDDPVTIGAMVGPEAVHRGQVPRGAPAAAGARRRRARWPTGSATAFGRDSGGLLSSATASRTPTWCWSRWARCSAPPPTSWTSCASEGVPVGSARASPASGPGRSTRCARRSPAPRRSIVAQPRRRGRRRAASSARTCGCRRLAARPGPRRRRRPRWPTGDPATVCAGWCSTTCAATAGSRDALTFPDLDASGLAELAAGARPSAPQAAGVDGP